MRLTEKDIFEKFQRVAGQYDPLIPTSIERKPVVGGMLKADALIEFKISAGPSFRALVEVTALASPKNIRAKCMAVLELARSAGEPDIVPLTHLRHHEIVFPFAKGTYGLASGSWHYVWFSGSVVHRGSWFVL